MQARGPQHTGGGAAVGIEPAFALRAERVSWWRSLVRFARRKPLGALGGLILLFMIGVAITAPWIAPYDYAEIRHEIIYRPPSSEHLMGTDDLGRDVFSRIIHGARISLYVGLLAALFAATGGGMLGLVCAFVGGRLDLFVQRVIDALQAFPSIILALSLVAVFGFGLNKIVIALSIVFSPAICRTIRSAALSIKETQYVEAARGIGCTDIRIMLVHVAPNCIAPWLILIADAFAHAILAEATLSFLGVGVPPPAPSWGGMLSGAGQRYVSVAPWLGIFPGIALSSAVFSLNLLGDALRDVLDPRLRRG